MIHGLLLVNIRTVEVHCKPVTIIRGTINELPDDILLEIFRFYMGLHLRYKNPWHVLVHVCRRWRCLVFASPRHLHLRLFLKYGIRVKEALEFWPEFPIVVHYMPWDLSVTDAIAALEQHDRVCEILIAGPPAPLGKIISAMKKPFPSLVELTIKSDGLIIPDSFPFLGGSAPRLESLELYYVQCPAIEKLLLSTPNLVSLSLDLLSHSERDYISPEAMVNGLSVLTRLKSLYLTFHWETPRSRSQQEIGHSSPFPRVVLPALTYIHFVGENEYLGDIVSRIDTPLLARIAIKSIDLSVSFTITPPLSDFIRRTENFGASSQIDVDDPRKRAEIEFFRRDEEGV